MTLMPRGLLQDAPPLRTEFEARCDILRKRFPNMRDYQIQAVLLTDGEPLRALVSNPPKIRVNDIVIWQCKNCGWNHYLTVESKRKCEHCNRHWVNVPTVFHQHMLPKREKS